MSAVDVFKMRMSTQMIGRWWGSMLARYPSPLVNIAHSCAILFVRRGLVIRPL